MKQFQGLAVLLLIFIFAAIDLFHGTQADTDVCPQKCSIDKTTEHCGELDGQRITYKNKCWLECRGNFQLKNIYLMI